MLNISPIFQLSMERKSSDLKVTGGSNLTAAPADLQDVICSERYNLTTLLVNAVMSLISIENTLTQLLNVPADWDDHNA